MNQRICRKVASMIYNSVSRGNLTEAASRLNKINSSQYRKVLTLFNTKAFESLGNNNGASLIMDFAAYRGYQKGMKAIGGSEGLAQTIYESMNLQLSKTLETACANTIESLPQSTFGWIKLLFKEKVQGIKNKIAKHFMNINNKSAVKKVKISPKAAKVIPEEFKGIFTDLSGKSGQDFTETAYQNMIKYMNLNEIAPKSITIKGTDGLMSVTGGYNPVTNSIEYSKGFLDRLSKKQQINLIAHELKHCEQFNNMIRTEGIGIQEYARALSENMVRNAIKESSLDDIMFRLNYKKALENGKGEEFIQNAIRKNAEKLIPELETNFAEILNMPKISATSHEGLNAYKHLEALRNYEGLDFMGLGGENYRNNPLEVEAYNFGDKIEKIFKKFMS